MRVARLFFPGEFEDAFVYMGRLLALTVDQTLRVYRLDDVLDFLQKRFSPSLAHQYLFYRNDWMQSLQFKSNMHDRDFSAAFRASLDVLPSDRVEFEPDDIPYTEFPLAIPQSILLDMNIYNGRLYVAANTGLYHLDLEWDDSSVTPRATPHKRLDTRCISTGAKYGVLNASCGDEGLFLAFDEFNWQKQRDRRPWPEPRPYADFSLRVGWLGHGLVNYQSHVMMPELFATSTEKKRTSTPETEDAAVIVTANQAPLNLDYLLPGTESVVFMQGASLDYVFNFDNLLFLHTTTGMLHIFRLKDYLKGNKPPAISKLENQFDVASEIFGLYKNEAGMIVETYDDAVIFNRNGPAQVLVENAISLRTFMQSKFYRSIVCATNEEGIYLIGLFDETAY